MIELWFGWGFDKNSDSKFLGLVSGLGVKTSMIPNRSCRAIFVPAKGNFFSRRGEEYFFFHFPHKRSKINEESLPEKK